MTERGLPPPNLYFALASIVHCFDMKRGATETIFAVGRSAGWVAHALDEYVRNGRRTPVSS
jgi:citrate synthase